MTREIVKIVGTGSSKFLDGTVIDMSKTSQSITISSDTTFTFENISDGSTTVLSVYNSDTIAHSVSFTDSSGVSISPTDAAVGVNSEVWTVYQIEKNTVGFFVQVLSVDSSNPFLQGLDGDLIILNGQNVDLNAGEIKDYNNIDIQAGGTLTLLDPSNTGDLVQIYAAGTFNIDGEIIGRDTENNGGSYSGNTLIGSAYSYTVTQATGGSGGSGGAGGGSAGAGGAGTNGYGGGGGGGGALYPGNSPTTGGTGGSNNGNGGAGNNHFAANGPGGAGNSTQGNGNNGVAGYFTGQVYPGPAGRTGGAGGGSGGGGGSVCADANFGGGSIVGASGGGGGEKGFHGANLFLYCPNSITGSGSINLSGLDGYNGGNGAAGATGSGASTSGSGGGGGGGAGGSGGNLRYTTPSLNPSVDVSGGSGGTGGTFSGQNGTAGNNGTVQNI